MFFSLRKKPIVLLVVDTKNTNHVGVLDVPNPTYGFRTSDQLKITGRHTIDRGKTEVLMVVINGGSGACTVHVRNGTYEVGQMLRIESIEPRNDQ